MNESHRVVPFCGTLSHNNLQSDQHQELGLPFTYFLFLPFITSNLYCAYYHDYLSTDGEFTFPLCSHCVGIYNSPHLLPITDKYKAYEKYQNTLQEYHNLYRLRHEGDRINIIGTDFVLPFPTLDFNSVNTNDMFFLIMNSLQSMILCQIFRTGMKNRTQIVNMMTIVLLVRLFILRYMMFQIKTIIVMSRRIM